MIVKSKYNENLVQSDRFHLGHQARFEGDSLITTTTENITPVLQSCYRLREGMEKPTKGFGRLIGRIPETVYAAVCKARPELALDTNEMIKFLKSPEGSQFRTTKGGI